MFIKVGENLVNLGHVTHVNSQGAVVLSCGTVLECKDADEQQRIRETIEKTLLHEPLRDAPLGAPAADEDCPKLEAVEVVSGKFEYHEAKPPGTGTTGNYAEVALAEYNTAATAEKEEAKKKPEPAPEKTEADEGSWLKALADKLSETSD